MKPTRKILVVVTENWGVSTEEFHKDLARDIFLAGNAFSGIQIDIIYQPKLTPDTYTDYEGNRRITHDWFENNISFWAKEGGYHSSRFRFSKAQGRAWKLDSGIRGVNYSDNPNDFHGEGWICADADSVVKFKDGSQRLLYPKTLAHEEGHELKYAGLTDLEIHDFDFQNSVNNIEEFYKRLELRDNRAAIQSVIKDLMFSILQKLRNEILGRAIYPIPRDRIMKPSQGWLKKNATYKSGYHNGADFPVDHGEPLLAIHDGSVILAGNSKELGHYCVYECEIAGRTLYHLWPHLTATPEISYYARGERIGTIGSTGLSTGPHLHWTILNVRPLSVSHYVSLVDTRDKIIKNTIDPYLWALYAVDRIKP